MLRIEPLLGYCTPAMRTLPRLLPIGVFVACCAAASLCIRWDGRLATETLDYASALAVVQDPDAPAHHRKAAAGILVVHLRLAVRVLKSQADIQDQVDALLESVVTLVRESR